MLRVKKHPTREKKKREQAQGDDKKKNESLAPDESNCTRSASPAQPARVMRLCLPVSLVAKTFELYEGVTRLSTADGTTLDIPSSFCRDLRVGTRFSLEIGDETSEFVSPDCVMQGVVYAKKNSSAFISSGGLLAKIERAPLLDVNQCVRLAIIKAKTRKRDASSIDRP